jgi:hypothetical protein
MLIFAAFGLLQAPASPASAADSCVKCHTEIGDELAAPVKQIEGDVHGRRGFSCVSCHGGDPKNENPEGAMDPRRGFIGRPSQRQVQALCAKCHSDADFMRRFNPALRVDQEAEYATSVHGQKIAQGDTKPATCISCHGYHGVRAVKDSNSPVFATRVAETCGRCHSDADYMKPYGIPTNQAGEYKQSIHAEALLGKQDLSAPTCNDCHGNHGATPPGVSTVANICGTCHVRQSELFTQSQHAVAFESLGLSQCVVCHSNHNIDRPTDESIGTAPQSFCVKCHDPGSPGLLAAAAMYRRLRELDGKIVGAEEILARAERAGMPVSRPRFELASARDGLINARVVVHNFDADALDKVIAPSVGIAEKAFQAGEAALEELQFRRKGLAVSLVIIAFAVLSLYLKIRQIEGKHSK